MLAKLGRAAVLVVVAIAAIWFQAQEDTGSATGGGVDQVALQDDANLVLASFEAERSDVWVETGGIVERTLADDVRGSQHQRFIVRLSNGHSVLIAHNIDLAPKVPLGTGDRVRFRGEYEWNNKGGVVHWTHHDPKGRRDGGWIAFAGEVYQ